MAASMASTIKGLTDPQFDRVDLSTLRYWLRYWQGGTRHPIDTPELKAQAKRDIPVLEAEIAAREAALGKSTQRTTVELDMALVQRAQEVLGTKTIRETIDEALREVDRRDALRRGAEMINKGGLNLATPEDLAQLRRPQD